MMNQRILALVAFAAASTLGGCASPTHLTYDFGRAYDEAIIKQADLSRAAAQDAQYQLYGVEAAEIRIRVQQEATDQESAQTTIQQN